MASSNQTNAIDCHGDTIVERLNQVQASNMVKTSEDFKQLKVERDNAVKKVHLLFPLNGTYYGIYLF